MEHDVFLPWDMRLLKIICCFSETLDKNSLFSLLMLKILLRESVLIQVRVSGVFFFWSVPPPRPPAPHGSIFFMGILVESHKHIFKKPSYIFCSIEDVTKKKFFTIIFLLSQKIQVISVYIFPVLFVYISLFYLSNKSIWILFPSMQQINYSKRLKLKMVGDFPHTLVKFSGDSSS